MLDQAFASAIKNDYLLVICIESQVRGLKQSVNLPFGLGKSTLALEYAFKLVGGTPAEYESAYSKAWNEVFDCLYFTPAALIRGLVPKPGKKAVPKAVCVFDATQVTAGADNSVPTVIRRFANFISDSRPMVKVVIFTAPNISSIAAPLRKLITHIIIVWKRGAVEVQKIQARLNYDDPRSDRYKLTYVESSAKAFGPLPPQVQERYETVRAQFHLVLRKGLLKSLEHYENLGKDLVDKAELTDEEKEERSEIGRALARTRWKKEKLSPKVRRKLR